MSVNKHLEHVEDYVLDGNFTQAIDVIAATAIRLCTHYNTSTLKEDYLNITTKYDGAPAIVFGINPDNRKFFIGTKSVFNKKIPKICYSGGDIENHYGDKRDLCEKLKVVFDDLSYEYFSFGSFPEGVYQCDLMYIAQNSLEYDDKSFFFTPNTITYRASRESHVGQKIADSSMGIVVHTRYDGDSMDDLRARYDIDHATFTSNVVNFIDPSISLDNVLNSLQFDGISDLLDYCERTWKAELSRSIFGAHSEHLKKFINHCVRIGESNPESAMYEVYLKNRELVDLAGDFATHRKEITSLFSIHRCLSQCKRIILEALKKTEVFTTEVNGRPTGGEGFVVTYHGVPCKFVNRIEFSRMNFANPRFAKA